MERHARVFHLALAQLPRERAFATAMLRWIVDVCRSAAVLPDTVVRAGSMLTLLLADGSGGSQLVPVLAHDEYAKVSLAYAKAAESYEAAYQKLCDAGTRIRQAKLMAEQLAATSGYNGKLLGQAHMGNELRQLTPAPPHFPQPRTGKMPSTKPDHPT